MADESPTDSLRTVLASLSPIAALGMNGTSGELRDKLCAVVHELKDGGMAPEQVVLAVKAIAREANASLVGSRLIDELTKWCIEEYFRR